MLELAKRDEMRRLVDRLLEACADPRYERRKAMWTAHQHLQKVAKVPVHVHLFLSGDYSPVWQELIPEEQLVHKEGVARNVELQLRQRLYKHDNIPDDDVILPVLFAGAVFRTAADRIWGLKLERREAQQGVYDGGAYKPVPPINAPDPGEAEIEALSLPQVDIDEAATARQVEQMQDLVEGRLPIIVSANRLGESPIENAVDLRGMDNLLYDVLDRPAFVHRLMDFVTQAIIRCHREVDRLKRFDTPATWHGCRVHYEEVGPEVLQASSGIETAWAYISAQSAAGLSPAMFEEFLQPYHERIASLYSPGRVYYHGCEDLTAKFRVIRRTPHLRRFHVSPWSDFRALAPQIGRDFVIEKHVHPTNNLLLFTEEQMRSELEEALAIGGDLVMDLNLSDIHTVGHRPERLTTWARLAQQVTEQHSH